MSKTTRREWMTKNHNKKNTKKLPSWAKLGTQEDCDRINKGGVTLTLWNRYPRKLERKDKK